MRWNGAVAGGDARGYVFTAPIERAVLLQEMITPAGTTYRTNAVA